MEANQLLINIALGGVLGIIGQGIRVIIGLGKAEPDTLPQPGRLLYSLFIGLIAGALAMLVKTTKPEGKIIIDKELILAIIAAGYAGADFIEGIFNTMKNKVFAPKDQQAMRQ